MDRVVAAVALGSNLGDRQSHLSYGAARLRTILANVTISSFFETKPHGVPGVQPDFLNAAAVGTTTLSARDLLNVLMAIEGERARERPFVGAPRTLDLDLVLFGDQVISESGLEVPHPRFRNRRFVLEPLAGIAPHLVDPVTRKTVMALLMDCRGSG